jgi:SAM-dependent methyltransferase
MTMSDVSVWDDRRSTRNGSAGALMGLAKVMSEYQGVETSPRWHSQWAWDNYEDLVCALALRLGLHDVCEIGGGRDPIFTAHEAEHAGINLIVNDIDAGELARAPAGLSTACFDVSGDLSEIGNQSNLYDMMISRMVFEHVENVPQAWANIYQLLRPGGVGLCFIPTLYALPFAINHLIPESVSSRIVKSLFPNRSADGGDPKFPARYEWCFGSERKLRRMLDPIGFSDVHVLPFWGHGYFKRMPGLREADHGFNWLMGQLNIRTLTTYAYVIVRK